MTFKIKEGDIIFCSSKLTWKSAILFPARFLIQATTLSQYEHVAQFINGKIAEANAKKGTILTPLQTWVIEAMLNHWILTKGAKYPFSKALYSSLDCLIPSSLKEPSLRKEQFCSEGVLRALKKAVLLPENLLARYYTPQELFELLVEVGFKHFEDINPKSIYS
jgi:hypothetical protein